jgi:hypothetical protein
MSIRRMLPLFVSVLILSFAGILQAQNQGSLTGQVTDPNGKSVSGANVHLLDLSASGLASRDAITDSNGDYSFAQIRPGLYSLKVEATGFKLFVQERVEILVSTPSTLNVALQLGAVTEQVVVTAESAPTINATDATVGVAFSEHEVKALPFYARNVVGLLTLQPGVVFTGASDLDRLSEGTMSALDQRDGTVNGVRGNQMNITLDGGDANDWQNHEAFTSAIPITLDSVQEFRVTTGNSNSTDGVASGPQIALVTKSGTNEFHGNVRWYYRTSGTSANSYFSNLNQIGRPRLVRNIPGASLGGPIWKDRIFFFTDFEDRQDRSQVLAGPRQVPSAALRDGALIYQCTTASSCPATTVQGKSGTNWTVPAGDFGLTPAQITQIDPGGLGINSKMLTYMGLFPMGNSPGQSNDGGLSFNAFSFNSPNTISNNIYTARMDFNITKDGRHSAYVRASMAGIADDLLPPQFPGQPIASILLNNSRGITSGYTAQLTPNFVNNFHYTFTRLGEAESGSTAPSLNIRFFDDNTAFNRGFNRQVPTHEVKDDISWVRGKHTFLFGAGLTFVRNNRVDNSISFPSFQANPGNCNDCGTLQGNLGPNPVTMLPDATHLGLSPGQLPSQSNFFNAAYLMLTGSLNAASATFFANPHTGAFLPAGSPEARTFAQNIYSGYFQDSWKVRPTLNITLGARYEYQSPPWETNGFQVAPTTDVYQWLLTREADAANGIGSNSSPLLSWAPAGKANGARSWYSPNYNNVSPHVAFAWSPGYNDGILKHIFGGSGKSSIRGGFGVYYDQIGMSLAVDSDQNGSPGTATKLTNSTTSLGLKTAPRFDGTCDVTGCTSLPSLTTYFPAPTSASFPATPSLGSANQDFVVDPHLRTPYIMSFSLDWQRELGKGVVLDVGYVGTLGRRLLTKADFAESMPLTDPASKLTIYQAYQKIIAVAGAGKGFSVVSNPNIDPANFAQLQTIQNIQFFNNMMPNMPSSLASFIDVLNNKFNFDPGISHAQAAALTPTQAFYSFAFLDLQTSLGSPSWSCALFALDTGPTSKSIPILSPWNSTLDPTATGNVLFTPQFNGLAGWANFGSSNYHSLQVGVRRNRGNFTFAANYVFSKSIDNASTGENVDLIPDSNGPTDAFRGLIYTPWDLRQNRAVSDFNLRHNFNASFGYQLPFGRGQRLFSGVGRLTNEFVSGWEISGLVRWRSGFPVSPSEGFNFPTDFFLTGPGQVVAPISSHITRTGTLVNNIPNLFADPQTALVSIGPVLPGFTGSRNVITGPAYAGVDMDLHKSFAMPWSEKQRLQLRVSVYNMFNSVNFGDGLLSLDPTAPNTFGQFANTIGNNQGGGRQMEFGVRFQF